MRETWAKSASLTASHQRYHLIEAMGARACNCIGPQNGQPRCPCMMVGIVERDGRWVQLERDLGPVAPHWPTPTTSSRSE